MKISNKAVQKNFIINKGDYTFDEIITLLKEKTVFWFDMENDRVTSDALTYVMYRSEDLEIRIFADKIKELKIALDKDGFYGAYAVLEDGISHIKSIRINL